MSLTDWGKIFCSRGRKIAGSNLGFLRNDLRLFKGLKLIDDYNLTLCDDFSLMGKNKRKFYPLNECHYVKLILISVAKVAQFTKILKNFVTQKVNLLTYI